MKIDSHQHFWQFDPVRYSWIDASMKNIQKDFMPEDLWPHLEKNGIAGTVAVQADESREETLFLLKLSHQYQWIRKTVGWIDFSSSDFDQQLENYSQEPRLVGFRKVLQAYPPEIMEDKSFLNGIGKLEKYGFTYDILIYPKHLEASYRFAKKFPNQAFIVDHLAKPDIKNAEFDYWSKGISKLASLPNVHCKISGMVTEANWQHWQKNDFSPYLDHVTEQFGTDRLMFGSDWPVCLIAADYEKVHDLARQYYLDFSEQEQEKIFGENACRFYGIEDFV